MTVTLRPDIDVVTIGRPVESQLVKELVAIAATPNQSVGCARVRLILAIKD
ncbi:MAG: hypothetical protein ACSHX3_13965 [Litorimonas sp.]